MKNEFCMFDARLFRLCVFWSNDRMRLGSWQNVWLHYMCNQSAYQVLLNCTPADGGGAVLLLLGIYGEHSLRIVISMISLLTYTPGINRCRLHCDGAPVGKFPGKPPDGTGIISFCQEAYEPDEDEEDQDRNHKRGDQHDGGRLDDAMEKVR